MNKEWDDLEKRRTEYYEKYHANQSSDTNEQWKQLEKFQAEYRKRAEKTQVFVAGCNKRAARKEQLLHGITQKLEAIIQLLEARPQRGP